MSAVAVRSYERAVRLRPQAPVLSLETGCRPRRDGAI
jgi:hypothetical protein